MLEINHLLNSLETDLRRIITERQLINPLMIGVRTGGVWIAEQLHRRLGHSSVFLLHEGQCKSQQYYYQLTRDGALEKSRVMQTCLRCKWRNGEIQSSQI